MIDAVCATVGSLPKFPHSVQLERPYISVLADCQLIHLGKYISLDVNFETVPIESIRFFLQDGDKVRQNTTSVLARHFCKFRIHAVYAPF
jgi:hypothetical protein